MVGEVHADGEVGAAAVHREVGAFAAERLPESENGVADGAVALRREALAVEELPGAAGGVRAAAEAEGVGEPDGVGAGVGEIRMCLAAQELPERRPFGDAVRITGVGRGVGMEAADGVDAAERRAVVGVEEDFGMPLVAERRLGELRAGIERDDERQRLAEDVQACAAGGGALRPFDGGRELLLHRLAVRGGLGEMFAAMAESIVEAAAMAAA